MDTDRHKEQDTDIQTNFDTDMAGNKQTDRIGHILAELDTERPSWLQPFLAGYKQT